jgi:hypothetical protein
MIYKGIKLISGELVACGIDVDEAGFEQALESETFITVNMPVSFYSVKFNEDGQVSEVVGIQPWIPISKAPDQKLAASAIIGLSEMDDKAIDGYKDFWTAYEERDMELDLEDMDMADLEDEADIMEPSTVAVGKRYH